MSSGFEFRPRYDYHPEFGYLCPSPALLRRVRTMFVAATLGAIAGGGTVFALSPRPVADLARSTSILAIHPGDEREASILTPHALGPLSEFGRIKTFQPDDAAATAAGPDAVSRGPMERSASTELSAAAAAVTPVQQQSKPAKRHNIASTQRRSYRSKTQTDSRSAYAAGVIRAYGPEWNW